MAGLRHLVSFIISACAQPQDGGCARGIRASVGAGDTKSMNKNTPQSGKRAGHSALWKTSQILNNTVQKYECLKNILSPLPLQVTRVMGAKLLLGWAVWGKRGKHLQQGDG